MKNTISLFLSIVVFSGAFAQNESCLKFKTGKFTYMDDSSNAVDITRTSHKQEEFIQSSGILIKFKVKWFSECEYHLTQTWSNSKQKRKQNGSVTKVLITRVYDNMYEYTCACNTPEANKKHGTAVKLN